MAGALITLTTAEVAHDYGVGEWETRTDVKKEKAIR